MLPAFLSFIGCGDGLGSVFDDIEIMPGGNLHDGVHVAHLAIEVDRNDGLGARTDRCFDLRGIEVVGSAIDVDEDRHSSHARNTACGGKECE